MLELETLATRYQAEADGILATIQQLCWDNDRQMFREGPSYLQYSQHAQVFAVLTGVVDGSAARRLMTHTLTNGDLVQCSFVMRFYLFRALEQAGLYAQTEPLWSKWRYLLEQNLTTVPEVPGPMIRCDCHAWGVLPLFELPRRFLGVTPLELSGKRDGDLLTLSATFPVPCRVVLPDGRLYWFAAGPFVAGELWRLNLYQFQKITLSGLFIQLL